MNDFITSILKKWSLYRIVFASSILHNIIMMNYKYPTEYSETVTSSHIMINYNNTELNMRDYLFTTINNTYYYCMEKYNNNWSCKCTNYDDNENQLLLELRTIVILCFSLDIRVQRFIMSENSIHKHMNINHPIIIPNDFMNYSFQFIQNIITHSELINKINDEWPL